MFAGSFEKALCATCCCGWLCASGDPPESLSERVRDLEDESGHDEAQESNRNIDARLECDIDAADSWRESLDAAFSRRVCLRAMLSLVSEAGRQGCSGLGGGGRAAALASTVIGNVCAGNVYADTYVCVCVFVFVCVRVCGWEDISSNEAQPPLTHFLSVRQQI